MNFREWFNKFWVLGASLLALVISRWDMGLGGAFFVVLFFTAFIFLELYYIRTTILNLYAEAITEHKFLLFFLRRRGINYLINGVISLYLSFYLFIHTNTSSIGELTFFLIAGLLLTIFTGPLKTASEKVTKEKPSKVFSRVGVIFIAVLITVLLDGLYNAFLPPDRRITAAFDVNIPLYVIDDIDHSYIYLQHFLRTVLYIKYNIQSIGLHNDIGGWFVAIRFLLLLSPTPYIAYALLFLSFMAVKKLRFETER